MKSNIEIYSQPLKSFFDSIDSLIGFLEERINELKDENENLKSVIATQSNQINELQKK